MAGDWIKMRGNLWDDPRVAKLCDLTDQGEAAVIGGLYWLWSTADQHSEDGVMPGLALRQIDRKTGVQGFGEALVSIGWLADHPEGVRIVRFEEHNGASAKKRCQTAKRVSNFKAANAEVTHTALPDEQHSVSTALPREEKRKRREDTSSLRSEVDTASPQRGSRLPKDWSLPDDWAAWAKQTRPDLNQNETANRFADYWHGIAGAKGRKADWLATWRNWVRNQNHTKESVPHSQSMSFSERDDLKRRRRWEEMTGRKWPNEETFSGETIDTTTMEICHEPSCQSH